MSGFLVDTNIVSESVKPRPDRRVAEWLAGVAEETVFLSAITVGEIRKGIERMAAGRRRNSLEVWLTQGLLIRFAGRILPIDGRVMQRWGVLMADSERRGMKLPSIDSLLIATAIEHGLTLVTRDSGPAKSAGVPYLDPWI